jgi:cbb3-type cytochrome oxidase maturation protein
VRRACGGGVPPARGGRAAWARGVALAWLLALAPRPVIACAFCEVGARDAWRFILIVVGSFIAGAAFVLVWSVRSGQFRDSDVTSRRVLELDRLTGVRI